MSELKLVYVAGKYRGATPWEVENNIRKAEEAGFALANQGFVPVIPHTMFRHFDKTLTDDFWLGATLEIMRRCDLIYMLPGWEQSAGAVAEHAEAARLGIQVLPTERGKWR